jgi:hypothetical protein
MKKFLVLFAALLAFPSMAHAAALFGQASGSGSQITLTWTASVTTGGTVNVYRCVGSPCTATSSFSKLSTGVVAAGPYNDATVTAGAYSYFVTALVNGAESVPSNTVTISVLPQPPTGLVAANP